MVGTVVIGPGREAKAHMLAMNPGPGRLYSVDDGVMEAFWLKDMTAVISSCTEPPETLTF